jgi:CheY-like chemotaxis protein
MDLRVVIADSDLAELQKLKSYFLVTGCSVVPTSDGVACIEALQVFQPDVLVIDDELPWGGCDGVLACLGEDGGAPQIPLVVVMSDGYPGTERLGHPSDVAFIAKPFRLPELFELIQCAMLEHELAALSA